MKKLTLSWQERLRFTLDETFAFSRIKFLDILESQRQDADADNPLMVVDIDFTIMALSFSAWTLDLLACFGGAKALESVLASHDDLKNKLSTQLMEMA